MEFDPFASLYIVDSSYYAVVTVSKPTIADLLSARETYLAQ